MQETIAVGTASGSQFLCHQRTTVHTSEDVVILDALATGPPAAARKAMTAHIISRLAAVLTTLADDQPK